jgi:hypothetical protein
MAPEVGAGAWQYPLTILRITAGRVQLAASRAVILSFNFPKASILAVGVVALEALY